METKSVFTSPAFWGLVAAIVSVAGKQFGFTFDEAGLTNDLVALSGMGIMMYDRFKATQSLHVVAPKVPDASKPSA